MISSAQLPFILCELYITKFLLPYRDYTRRKATHILRKKSEAAVPARSTTQRQFDENQTISSRHPIKRQEHYKASQEQWKNTNVRFKILRRYIITIYQLNNIFVQLCYLCSMVGSQHAQQFKDSFFKGLKMTIMQGRNMQPIRINHTQ